MDKSKIKTFAVWARRNLISAVSDKAARIGITKDKIYGIKRVQGGFIVDGNNEIFYLSPNDRERLISQINQRGYEQVIEEVAYTWFNRFMGLRYMEVNDYLPSGIRILSSAVEGKREPDVLTNVPEIIDKLQLDAEKIYNLLDSGLSEDREKAYRTILVKQCNELGKIMPQMFEKIEDYTELLLPDNLLLETSVISHMVSDIDEQDWLEEVEIIGWMYQYYISEKKNEVFEGLKKNIKITKENIPAATQLFTPKWIVKYMVENSLGRLWLEGHPNEQLQSQWKYYLEEAKQEPDVEEELKQIRLEHSHLSPEDIRVLDPCMGSGHILVYAFDVLYEIYRSAGYTEREIPKLILKNNLYGLDIDDRAAQLASFALIMKARHYNRRLFREIEREQIELNLCSIQESNDITEDAIDYLAGRNMGMRADAEYLVKVYTDAKEYGSILDVEKVDFKSIKQRLLEIADEDNLMLADSKNLLLTRFADILKQAEIMSRKYEACVTNPPYMGSRGINNKLVNYIKEYYPKYKADMFSVFIRKNLNILNDNCYCSMVTPESWMFISTYTDLRFDLINSGYICNLIQLGQNAFESGFGTVAFVFTKELLTKYTGTYISLENFKQDDMIYSSYNILNMHKYYVNSLKFKNMPNYTIAYWVSQNICNVFNNYKRLEQYGMTRQGMATSDNNRFLRSWYEVNINKITFNNENGVLVQERWVPYNKGGEFRKWYGCLHYLIDWNKDGKDVKEYASKLYGSCTRTIKSISEYFKESITWPYISSNDRFGARYQPKGFIFDVAGPSLFIDINLRYYICALLCSKLSKIFMKIINPTMNFQTGDIAKIPVVVCNDNIEIVNRIVKENINISKTDWDSFETSWDFTIHPLIKFKTNESQSRILDSFSQWSEFAEKQFYTLRSNEEELNRIFIEIYGLQDELTPDVEEKDVTIRKADRQRDIKSFISYGVGCMFGRYSIDADGLIYAGGEFEDRWNIENSLVRHIVKDDDNNITTDEWVSARYIPDVDNIIPITDEEYFEDDIVSKFVSFVRVVYGQDYLEENLDYIADSLDRKSTETSRQAIRRYFMKEFYKDHLKIYQHRPIYWMFDSGKENGFKALIYMHRYNPHTIAKLRTEYLHRLQRKYESELDRLSLMVSLKSGSTKDITVARKRVSTISKQIEELKKYDQVVSYVANEQIDIDLDDGVKVNYAKFQDVDIIGSTGKKEKMNLLAKLQ